MAAAFEIAKPGARRCPACGETMMALERHGVEIDRCPECGGVWLDRGEYGRLMDRLLRKAIEDGEAGFEKFDRGEPKPRRMRPTVRSTYESDFD